MTTRLKYWPAPVRLALALGALFGIWKIYPIYLAHLPTEFMVSIVAAIYFLTQHSLEERRFSRELFAEFNRKYNDLNEDLFDIVNNGALELSGEDKKILVDYFNLCAEEWLQYDEGHIRPSIWESWNNGMKSYYTIPKIQEFWDQELLSNSYYGFSAKYLK
jgi:hypothetical protein